MQVVDVKMCPFANLDPNLDPNFGQMFMNKKCFFLRQGVPKIGG